MDNFNIPSGYTERAILKNLEGNITHTGYSKLGTSDYGSWLIKKIEIIDTLTRIYYAEGTWDDVLILNYK